MLGGRHDGLVGTKALGEENGPCLLYGYDHGFVFGFLSSTYTDGSLQKNEVGQDTGSGVGQC